MNKSIKLKTYARYSLAWALLALSGSVLADAGQGALIAAEGNGSGAAACMVCHGANGEGNAVSGFPRLAGMDKKYMVRQLTSFQTGSRKNPIMHPMARTLTPQQINDVADYYAQLKIHGAPATRTDPALVARGKKLATEGKWNKGVPACFACHGSGGTGLLPNFPPLAGQNAAYLANQLAAWQAGTRKNDPQGLMKAVADKLDRTDIQAVAAYLATLNSPAGK